MISIDVSGDLGDLAEDLRRAPAMADERVRDAVEKNADKVVDAAKQDAPVSTPNPFDYRKPPPGRLRASISADLDGDGMGYEAGPTVDYGHYPEFGTVPHAINAKPGGPLLAWPDAGTGIWNRRRHVWHPGNPPMPYMIPNFERYLDDFENAVGDAGERIL